MKNRLTSIFVQTIGNIFALWVVFVKKNSWFTFILSKVGINNSKAQVGILAALAILLSNLIIMFLEWLFFEIIFKPIKIELSFRNSLGNKPIKHLTLEYRSQNAIDLQKSYKLHISVSEGNKITNRIVNFIKSDIIVVYRPKYYDTEIVNGWLSQTEMSPDNVYKDKKNNTRVYWSHVLEGASRIDDSLIIVPELIVKPKSLEGYKCQVELRIGSHSKRNKFFRVIFKMVYFKLITVNTKKLTIYLKKVN